MLHDNIKNLRKAKGLSQEELAITLNVVRQTISKWETGLSVPDSEMLLRLAEVLDTEVSVLLCETVEKDGENELKAIAAKLEIINEQIARYNERRRKTRRACFIALAVLSGIALISALAAYLQVFTAMNEMNASVSIIGGADGPTAIFVVREAFDPILFFAALACAVVSVIGIMKTRK